jgi:AraC-like DNA-binding protein
MVYNYDELSFSVLSADKYLYKDGFYEVKPRPYAALSYRISGMGAFEVGDKKFTVRAGDVLFMPSDTPYKVEYSRGEAIVIHLSNCNYTEAEGMCLENAEQAELRFKHLNEAWNGQITQNRAKSEVYSILDVIANDNRISFENTAFAACVRYIDTNFCDPALSVEHVCAHGFISASGLQRYFNRYYGISPKQYIIKLRLERAAELLLSEGLSVKEIAFTCGFTDEKYFSRLFKKKYGYSPTHLKNGTDM